MQYFLDAPETVIDLTCIGPVTLTRASQPNLVLMTEDEYLSMRETLDLLGSQLNAERLAHSLEQSRAKLLIELTHDQKHSADA